MGRLEGGVPAPQSSRRPRKQQQVEPRSVASSTWPETRVAAARPGAGPLGWSPRRPGPTQFPRHRVTEAGGPGTAVGAGAGYISVRTAALEDPSPGCRTNGTWLA